MSDWIDLCRISDLRARVDYLESIAASQQAEIDALRQDRARLQRMIDRRHVAAQPDRRRDRLSDLQIEILDDIAQGHDTIADLSEWLGISPSALAETLRRLELRGLVVQDGDRWLCA